MNPTELSSKISYPVGTAQELHKSGLAGFEQIVKSRAEKFEAKVNSGVSASDKTENVRRNSLPPVETLELPSARPQTFNK